jgi:FKBP-type peptidyl-prolyl cis-trans isomerase FkpA
MKQKIFTFLILLSAVIAASCNKDRVYPDIKEYDAQQIQEYIKNNNLSSMVRDTTNGDTSGIYYQIIDKGLVDSPSIKYSDRVAMVYTIRSFDGKYFVNDTILNHYSGYLGQFKTNALPAGLQYAIYNLLKHKGGSMRVLIPSRQAYGVNGYGSGSSSNTNTRIAGNQCLDYWVRIVGNQNEYDDLSIRKYATANGVNLTGYSKTSSGLYYKLSGVDTGKVIKSNSDLMATYKLSMLNNTVIQEVTEATDLGVEEVVPGVKEAFQLMRDGQSIDMLVPSNLAYGQSVGTSGLPAFSCLRWQFTITSVTNYPTGD